MLPLVVAVMGLGPVPEALQLAALRKQFGELDLPAGCHAEAVGRTGIRFRVPAGRWHGTLFWGQHRRLIPRVSTAVEGDFVATVRVRLRLDPSAGAAGVTEISIDDDGTRRGVATPEVLAGLYVCGDDRGFAQMAAHARRLGDARSLRAAFQMSSPAGGAGGSNDPGTDDFDRPLKLVLKRDGDSVTVAGGPESKPEADWGQPYTYRVLMPRRVDVRLFATGNLDKPFAVEFDRLTVTPLAAAKK